MTTRPPSRTFAAIVPYLILFATFIFAAQGPITRRLRRRHQVPPSTPVWYEADENQIRQIVWNLATNGLRAMKGGGRLRLSVSVFNTHDDIDRVVGVLAGKTATSLR